MILREAREMTFLVSSIFEPYSKKDGSQYDPIFYQFNEERYIPYYVVSSLTFLLRTSLLILAILSSAILSI